MTQQVAVNLPSQDAEAVALATQPKRDCEVCGKEGGGIIWLHCDSWTKWLRYGCGTNVMYCSDACKEGADRIRKERVSVNAEKAKQSEINTLKKMEYKDSNHQHVLSRFLDTFDESKSFFDWVVEHIGEEGAVKFLKVPCDCCGNYLGATRYSFETPEGERSRKTAFEIERYCYDRTGLNPENELFKDDKDKEIVPQTSTWDYYERKGWEHNGTDDMVHWREARDAIRNTFWDSGYFFYHMPTKTFLGKMAKRGGDWTRFLQLNYGEEQVAQDALREKYGGKDEYSKSKNFWKEFGDLRTVQERQEVWGWYCGEDCMNKYRTKSTCEVHH